MASSYVDRDMRILRSNKYTPTAANEARTFIEECLGEKLAPGDLLEVLRDGITLCKLVNQVVPGLLRYKANAHMPFIQMENIALFLEACKTHPFNIQSHDVFLTVDLYESKDPAQVLQCLGAFSRAVHRIDPIRFPNPIGVRARMSFQASGTSLLGTYRDRERDASCINIATSNLDYDVRSTLSKSKTGDSDSRANGNPKNSTRVSILQGLSNSGKVANKETISPPWNIFQYGYTGGASQGNLGVSFGGRRQITSVGPHVPSVLDREKKQKHGDLGKDLPRQETESFNSQPQGLEESEEEKAIAAEEITWSNETERIRKEESLSNEEDRILDQENFRSHPQEENSRECRFEAEFRGRLTWSDSSSNTNLSDESSNQDQDNNFHIGGLKNPESDHIKELERELELAREREREYEQARKKKILQQTERKYESDSANRANEENQSFLSLTHRSGVKSQKNCDGTCQFEEPKNLPKQSHISQSTLELSKLSVLETADSELFTSSTRQLPKVVSPARIVKQKTASRPLPDPAKYATTLNKHHPQADHSVSNYNQFLQAKAPITLKSKSMSTLVKSGSKLDNFQQNPQSQVEFGNLIANSFVVREIELERQREQELEKAQRELNDRAVDLNHRVDFGGGDLDGRWDVSQWTGFTRGDSPKCIQSIENGRRQIVGPRPPPSR